MRFSRGSVGWIRRRPWALLGSIDEVVVGIMLMYWKMLRGRMEGGWESAVRRKLSMSMIVWRLSFRHRRTPGDFGAKI